MPFYTLKTFMLSVLAFNHCCAKPREKTHAFSVTLILSSKMATPLLFTCTMAVLQGSLADWFCWSLAGLYVSSELEKLQHGK